MTVNYTSGCTIMGHICIDNRQTRQTKYKIVLLRKQFSYEIAVHIIIEIYLNSAQDRQRYQYNRHVTTSRKALSLQPITAFHTMW